MSRFNSDLHNEQILAEYLDHIYAELELNTRRISDIKSQNKGIDLIIKYNSKLYNVDEKSQLHYLNISLPTFAFELSYLKDDVLKQGWLFDKKKETEYYFLITGIMLKGNKNVLKSKIEIDSLMITSVNRQMLLKLLNQRNIDKETIEYVIHDIRENKAFGKHAVDGLDNRKEGNIHFTKALSEQPINLVLKLDYLVKKGVAKIIFPNK